uniref:MIP09027p n=1 Tax=Drosophila melanogaster TaxID=7227 RepID=C1C3D7_DROME|nr:MIP09027p [Drosophila melanogaster]
MCVLGHIRDWKFLCRRKILVFYLFVYSSLAFRNICIPPQLQIYFFAKTHTRKKNQAVHIRANFLEVCFEFLRAQQQQQRETE